MTTNSVPDTRIRKESSGGWWVEVRRAIGKDVYRWTPTRWTAGTRRDAKRCEHELREDLAAEVLAR